MEKKSASNKIAFWRLTRREQTIAIVVLAFGLLGGWLPERIAVATSESVGYRVFFLSPPSTKIRTGDYLVFRHKEEPVFVQKSLTNNDRMIKKVGCTPGELLTAITERQFKCGDTSLGTALKTDSQGAELPTFAFNGPVPEGKLFMVGSNPRSFDSKYYGFVSENEILFRAVPIW